MGARHGDYERRISGGLIGTKSITRRRETVDWFDECAADNPRERCGGHCDFDHDAGLRGSCACSTCDNRPPILTPLRRPLFRRTQTRAAAAFVRTRLSTL